MKDIESIITKENYSICSIGNLDNIKNFSYKHPLLASPIAGKVFAGKALGTTSMEISFQSLPAKEEIHFDHRHRTHEEVYIVLKGKGTFIIDNDEIEVSEGGMVRISPEAKRRWKNPNDEELIVMTIQAVHNTLVNYTVFDGYAE